MLLLVLYGANNHILREESVYSEGIYFLLWESLNMQCLFILKLRVHLSFPAKNCPRDIVI